VSADVPDFDQEAKDDRIQGDGPGVPRKEATHNQKTLARLLRHGECTHHQLEGETGITTIRSRVSDLRLKYGWFEYIGKDIDENSTNEGKHAHYHVRWRALSLACGVRPEEIRTLAWKVDPRFLGTFEAFRSFVRANASELLGEYALEAEDPFGVKAVRLEGRA
jgi:hypothetical protein